MPSSVFRSPPRYLHHRRKPPTLRFSGEGVFSSTPVKQSAADSFLLTRHGSATPPSALRVPLPSLVTLPLVPQVTLALPPTLILHEPIALTYTLSNPTSRLLRLSTQVDSAPDPGTFVFAGPRKIPSLILAPSEQRELSVKVVPLVVGRCRLPRLRVFLHELDETEQEKATEIMVVAQEAVRKDPGLEEELREARAEEPAGSDFVVLVLPR